MVLEKISIIPKDGNQLSYSDIIGQVRDYDQAEHIGILSGRQEHIFHFLDCGGVAVFHKPNNGKTALEYSAAISGTEEQKRQTKSKLRELIKNCEIR